MAWIALKMLTGNRGRYYAIIFGIAFAVMLMAQQAAIFVGLMRNTTSQIRDIQGADIWVMNKSVEFVDDITPMSDNDLYRVRGVPGVLWAIQFYKGTGRAQFPIEGNFKQFIILGLDDETLVGAPQKLVMGSLGDLRQPDAVIIDEIGFNYLWPGQPLHIGQDLRDERSPGQDRRHLQGLADLSDVSDHLHALQPGPELRPAGTPGAVVRPGQDGAGRVDRGSVRPHRAAASRICRPCPTMASPG